VGESERLTTVLIMSIDSSGVLRKEPANRDDVTIAGSDPDIGGGHVVRYLYQLTERLFQSRGDRRAGWRGGVRLKTFFFFTPVGGCWWGVQYV
jgi:hypothetical protein